MNNSIFEVDATDIKALNDEELTELVARLCKADVTRADQSTTCVKHGGNINTPDEGFDVVVEWNTNPPSFSHLPRKITGIQIKTTNMTPSLIKSEMAKNIGEGKSINQLIGKSGAYIIVSSRRLCNPTDSIKCVNTMRQAVSGVPENEKLQLIFYGTEAIVDWVNEYPSIVSWAKKTIGKFMSGWQPYGDWSNSESLKEYILDDKLRLFKNPLEQGITVGEGIRIIREQLSIPGSSVRLVGLSGVGKTRLIQALFESSVGEEPLPEHLALYTDYNDKPIPDPINIVQTLKPNCQRIVLIIDNCSQEIHNSLTKLIKDSQVSLITAEYDVQDDLPQSTQVFLLEPASEEPLRKILAKRHPEINSSVLERIVDLSEGNSRVALALVEHSKSIGDFGTLRDEEIFNRLFWQRKDKSGDLFETAQACSLVYSFNSCDPGSAKSEIPLLALLRGQTPEVFFKNIFEIKNRKLLQSRGDMSALLPQAVANRIASECLGSFTKSTLESVFLAPGASRLLKSFCHRLSFLHEDNTARNIAKAWLSPSGLFGVKGLVIDDLQRTTVSYLFPLDFAVSLRYLERLVDLTEEFIVDNQFSRNINWIAESLLNLAYFEENFETALSLIEKLLVTDKTSVVLEEIIIKQINSLFWPRFSKTSASPLLRQTHISMLIKSSNEKLIDIGVNYLDSTFQTQDLYFFFPSNFGARPITLGYELMSYKEYKSWFVDSLQIFLSSFNDRPDLRATLLSVIEKNFRNLWRLGFLCDELSQIVHNTIVVQQWSKIWVEIKKTLFYDGKKLGERLVENLVELEESTRPKSLLEEARIFLNKSELGLFYTTNNGEMETSTSWRIEYENKIKELGEKVSEDLQVLEQIGPDLFTYENYWIPTFIESLTLNSKDPAQLWQILRNNYKRASNVRNFSILVSFFKTLQTTDPYIAELIHNEVSEDPEIKHIYPSIFIYKPNITSEIDIVSEMINGGSYPPHLFWGFGQLSIGDQISEQDFCRLLTNLAGTKEGYRIAIMTLEGKFEDFKKAGLELPAVLVQLGQKFLIVANDPEFFNRRDPMRDLYLSKIFASIPKSSFQEGDIRLFIDKLYPEGFEERVFYDDHPELNKLVGSEYPIILLNTLFSRIGDIDPIRNIYLYNNPDDIGQIIQCVDSDVIIKWMDEDLVNRAQFLSRYLSLVHEDKDTSSFYWTDFGRLFLNRTFDTPTVLDNIGFRLEPTGVVSSYAYEFRRRLTLLDDNFLASDARLIAWKDSLRSRWLDQIRLSEKREAEYDERLQTFEP